MSQSMAEVIGAVPFLNSLKRALRLRSRSPLRAASKQNDREFRELLGFSGTRSVPGSISIAFINCRIRPADYPI